MAHWNRAVLTVAKDLARGEDVNQRIVGLARRFGVSVYTALFAVEVTAVELGA